MRLVLALALVASVTACVCELVNPLTQDGSSRAKLEAARAPVFRAGVEAPDAGPADAGSEPSHVDGDG